MPHSRVKITCRSISFITEHSDMKKKILTDRYVFYPCHSFEMFIDQLYFASAPTMTRRWAASLFSLRTSSFSSTTNISSSPMHIQHRKSSLQRQNSNLWKLEICWKTCFRILSSSPFFFLLNYVENWSCNGWRRINGSVSIFEIFCSNVIS